MSRLVARHRATAKLAENFGSDIDGKLDIVEVLQFVQSAYELAFGDGAISKTYPPEEVLAKLMNYTQQSHFLESKAAPMLRRVEENGGEDFWEADLYDVVLKLDAMELDEGAE